MSTKAPFFPPYGYLNKDLMDRIQASPYPEGFVPPPGQTPQQAWKPIYDAMVDKMADVLWPRWNVAAQDWVGNAKATMQDLTDADLGVMALLRSELKQIARQQAAGQAPLATPDEHGHFFEIEDDDTADLPMMEYFPADDRGLLGRAAQAAGLAPLHQRVVHWMGAHCTAPTLPAKDEIRRPRAYQMTGLLRMPFEYEYARGAVTSALPSGHCIQGIQGVCAAYLELVDTKLLTADIESRLRQYAVDHGDRRVYAGVHYPSDNLASWCMALYLAPHLYGAKAALGKQFLKAAITDHSQVYRAIVASKEPAFAPGLTWFTSL